MRNRDHLNTLLERIQNKLPTINLLINRNADRNEIKSKLTEIDEELEEVKSQIAREPLSAGEINPFISE